jgi:hypothetical protein
LAGAAALFQGWTAAHAALAQGILIFLLNPYLIPAIKKYGLRQRARKKPGEGYSTLEVSVVEGRTQPGDDFELPQCTAPVPNGGSRRLQGLGSWRTVSAGTSGGRGNHEGGNA